jgi:hypothetical protein
MTNKDSLNIDILKEIEAIFETEVKKRILLSLSRANPSNEVIENLLRRHVFLFLIAINIHAFSRR